MKPFFVQEMPLITPLLTSSNQYPVSRAPKTSIITVPARMSFCSSSLHLSLSLMLALLERPTLLGNIHQYHRGVTREIHIPSDALR